MGIVDIAVSTGVLPESVSVPDFERKLATYVHDFHFLKQRMLEILHMTPTTTKREVVVLTKAKEILLAIASKYPVFSSRIFLFQKEFMARLARDGYVYEKAIKEVGELVLTYYQQTCSKVKELHLKNRARLDQRLPKVTAFSSPFDFSDVVTLSDFFDEEEVEEEEEPIEVEDKTSEAKTYEYFDGECERACDCTKELDEGEYSYPAVTTVLIYSPYGNPGKVQATRVSRLASKSSRMAAFECPYRCGVLKHKGLKFPDWLKTKPSPWGKVGVQPPIPPDRMSREATKQPSLCKCGISRPPYVRKKACLLGQNNTNRTLIDNEPYDDLAECVQKFRDTHNPPEGCTDPCWFCVG